MKKLLLLLISVFVLISCDKEEEEIVLEQVFEISLDGVSFDPYERYTVINTFGAVKDVDGFRRKIFVLYLQIDDGEPRLDRQHFALFLYDLEGDMDDDLLDVGTFDHLGTDDKLAGLEIIGENDYVNWASVEVMDVHDGLICFQGGGEFYNPYIDEVQVAEFRVENMPIGIDIEATPYGYLIN
tara:strand:+ start:1277 stop:1825 length:549 start_codon:yes stop_codon:yes gene_type:complete